MLVEQLSAINDLVNLRTPAQFGSVSTVQEGQMTKKFDLIQPFKKNKNQTS
jgi:hypothetical protein